MTFGERLKQLRAEKGMSQNDLARAAGIHKMTLAKIEQGQVQNPRWGMVKKLAKALGVTCEAFDG